MNFEIADVIGDTLQAISKLAEARLVKDTAVLYNNLAATSLQTSRPAAALHYCAKALQVFISLQPFRSPVKARLPLRWTHTILKLFFPFLMLLVAAPTKDEWSCRRVCDRRDFMAV